MQAQRESSRCRAYEWIEQAPIEGLYRFLSCLSLKLIDATIKDIASNNEERRTFGKRFFDLDDDFDAACIFANLHPRVVRTKAIIRIEILRERNDRRKSKQ